MNLFGNHNHIWGAWESIVKGEDPGYTQPEGYWQPTGHPPATFTRGRLIIQERVRQCTLCSKREIDKQEVFYTGANAAPEKPKTIPG